MSFTTNIVLSISALGLCFLGYKKSKDITANKKQMIGIFCALGGIYMLYLNLSKQANQKKIQSQPQTKPKFIANGLAPREYRKFKLIQKTNISHNTRRYRFALQTPTTILGLPTGKHISFRYFDNNENKSDDDEIRRPYTPVTSDRVKGYFDVVIKVYPKGKMSQHLEELVVFRDYIEARGPLGYIHYKQPGVFEIKQKRVLNEYKVNKINMLAGGTGITPMLQLISQIIAIPEDNTQVSLIFGNVSIDDILLYNELKEIREKYENIRIRFIIDKAPTDERKWDEDVGYITKSILEKQLFPASEDVITLNCGPPIMVKICTKNLIDLGYKENKIIAY